MATISYPSESFSIEIHIFVMVIATIVTVIGLCLGYFWTKKQAAIQNIVNPSLSGWQGVLKDIIPAAGIILAFVSPVITSVFNPILDYSVIQDPKNNSKLYVKIDNLGLVNAKKIEVYFYSADKNFNQFYSIPVSFNGSSFKYSQKIGIGNGIFYMSSLPPKSQTIVTAVTKEPLTVDNKVIIYVRSDVTTGIHNVGYLTAAYLVYAIALTFTAGYIMYTNWLRNRDDIPILFIVDVYFTVAIFLILFFGTCEGDGNCLSHGINTF